MTELGPVRQSERETFLDVLRGFAILGIFIANLASFTWYSENNPATGQFFVAGADKTMTFLHHMFIEGKFYTIFSLLFGWGMALQIKRASAGGANAIPVIRRRLLFMVLLGFIHLLIWTGDIVLFYALLGFILIPLRKFSNKTLLITAAILILSPILLYYLKMTWPVLNTPNKLAYQSSDWMFAQLLPEFGNVRSPQEFEALMSKTTWWDVFKANISQTTGRYGYLIFTSRIPKVLGMFLVGYVIGRTDFYARLIHYKKLVVTVIIAGLLIGLPANYFLAKQMQDHGQDYYDLKQNGFYQTIYYALGVVPLALAYVGIFMLSFKSSPGKKMMSFLAPVGKMAFTNYIMQSLIGNFVFLAPGLYYMFKVGPVFYTLFGIVVFIFQIIFSTIWLKYFNYGPVEWLWRSATYKKWQPMKKNYRS